MAEDLLGKYWRQIGDTALTVTLTGSTKRADFSRNAGATGLAAGMDRVWGESNGYDPKDKDDVDKARGF